MKWIKYSRYTGDDFGIDSEDLLRAIQQALENGQLFSDEQLEKMMEQLQAMSEEQMNMLLDKLVQKLIDDGHIAVEEPGQPQNPGGRGGNGPEGKVKFEVTDKSLDFLGFKTLKD